MIGLEYAVVVELYKATKAPVQTSVTTSSYMISHPLLKPHSRTSGLLHASHVLPRAAVRGDQPGGALLHRPHGRRRAVGPQARDAARGGWLPAHTKRALRGRAAEAQKVPRRHIHLAHRGYHPAPGARMLMLGVSPWMLCMSVWMLRVSPPPGSPKTPSGC
eukprot:3133273-Pyramimonas_sp.AAC.1